MGPQVDATFLVISVILFILMFLGLREVLCWYWKINKKLEKYEEQLDELKIQTVTLKNIETHLKSIDTELETQTRQNKIAA